MRVGLYSIPATGTRFISGALRHLGADYSRRHVGSPVNAPEWRRVLPVRHPYDVYLSHIHNKHSKNAAEFISKWASYLWRTQWMDSFYFPIEVPEDDRRVLLQELMAFCGLERDMELIDAFVWQNATASNRDRSLEVPDDVKKLLGFAVEWHDHYKVHWGAKYRHPNHSMGEGP